MYGGTAANDLWELSATGWQLMAQGGTLPAGAHPTSLVYDSVRQRTTVTNVLNGAVWEWDGATWTVRPASAITSFDGVTGFDPIRNRLQLVNSNGIRVLNNGSWNLASATGPDEPVGNVIFDPSRQRSIVIGISPVFSHAETWEWTGSQWTEMNQFSITRLHQLRGSAMAWDPVRSRMVVAFGFDCSYQGCPYNTAVWEYGR